MSKSLDFQKYFYISVFLTFTGFLSMQVYADGIASVNSYVEIKSSKVKAALSVLTHILLVALVMCQLEVQLR